MKKIFSTLGFCCVLLTLPLWAHAGHSVKKEDRPIKAKGLKQEVLDLALKAYSKASSQGLTHAPVLTVVDYSKPSTEPRLWVIDLEKKRTLFREFVAHGRDEQGQETKEAALFSNKPGSHASSLGVYLTGNTYSGKHGLSLKLKGLEKEFNSNAEKRAIVMHPAAYVSRSVIQQKGRLGSSYGCLSLRPTASQKIINRIKDGSLIFAYYPDPHWLQKSAFLNQ